MTTRANLLAAIPLVVLIWLASIDAATPQVPADTAGLTLPRAIELARQNHPSVGIAGAGVDVAAAAVGQAKSAWWPQVGTMATVRRFEKPMVVTPIHGFTQEEFDRIEFANTLVQGNLSVGWTIFDGARLNRIREARAGVAGAAAGLAEVEMMLTANVTVAYLRVLSARGVLDAVERRKEALDAERRRVVQLLEQGQAARVELLRVDASLAEAEADRVARATRLDLEERDLARWVDLAPEVTRFDRLVPVRLAESARLDARSSLVERALANNPELAVARRAVDAAEAEHRVARAAWIPSLSLGGGYQLFSSDEAIGGDGRTSTEWNLGISLSYPLFTGGGRSSAVRRAAAQARRAQEELRLAELRTREAVDRALNTALESGALVDALEQAVQHQSEVARIELLTLEAGAGTQTDYLRAEAALASVRAQLVEAQHAEIAAWVEVARVAGELTPEWVDRNLETQQ